MRRAPSYLMIVLVFGGLLWFSQRFEGDDFAVATPEDIVSAGGIRVHESIAADIELLLHEADDAGLELDGYGYRTNAQQVALRRRHCGTTQEAIYEMAPSECSPPTARPGRSRHEAGLAIDFTYEGRTIQSRSSPAFKWLDDNAGRFGLKNLPSEPWHWSTDGK